MRITLLIPLRVLRGYKLVRFMYGIIYKVIIELVCVKPLNTRHLCVIIAIITKYRRRTALCECARSGYYEDYFAPGSNFVRVVAVLTVHFSLAYLLCCVRKKKTVWRCNVASER